MKEKVAKRPGANKGGSEEERNRPRISIRRLAPERLRNMKLAGAAPPVDMRGAAPDEWSTVGAEKFHMEKGNSALKTKKLKTILIGHIIYLLLIFAPNEFFQIPQQSGVIRRHGTGMADNGASAAVNQVLVKIPLRCLA